ncbi:AtpZ/AtpI family protein [Patescibacteria group bacterium AH-259-L05]|nr:AtpZ/AtpI family protein [Patescibacteria group bacterium AH-259-L05]
MKKENKEKSVVWQSISIAMQLGYAIALPLVIFAIAGRILDKQYDSSPIFLLTGVVLSLIISSILVFIKIQRIVKEMDREGHDPSDHN